MSSADFVNRWNLSAIEEQYNRWRRDPDSVPESWRWFFAGFDLGSARATPPALDARAQTGVVLLIAAYRDLGHFLAHLDPLGERRTSHPLLELSQFGLSDADLDRSFDTSPMASRCASARHPGCDSDEVARRSSVTLPAVTRRHSML